MIDKGQWGEFGQDTGVTPLLFTRSAMGFLMTTESQDLGLTSHPKDSGVQYSTVLGEWGGLYQWFAQQSGLPSVVFWGHISLSWTRQLLTCRGRIQWWQSRTVSAAPVAGWTFSAGEGSKTSAEPFSQWSLFDCPASGPGRGWCPGVWMTPLQSQCCYKWVFQRFYRITILVPRRTSQWTVPKITIF